MLRCEAENLKTGKIFNAYPLNPRGWMYWNAKKISNGDKYITDIELSSKLSFAFRLKPLEEREFIFYLEVPEGRYELMYSIMKAEVDEDPLGKYAFSKEKLLSPVILKNKSKQHIPFNFFTIKPHRVVIYSKLKDKFYDIKYFSSSTGSTIHFTVFSESFFLGQVVIPILTMIIGLLLGKIIT